MSQQGGDVSLARDSPVEQVVSSVISQLQQQQLQQHQQHIHDGSNIQQQREPNSTEDDQVMVATERDLAEDAQWKRIQQNTFTRWANEHLKTVDKYIGNLETDLSDGLKLIALVEVLSGKKLPKHTKKPTFRSQKLENVSVALKFLEHDEGIRIVNIGKSKFKFYSLFPIPSSDIHVALFVHVVARLPPLLAVSRRILMLNFSADLRRRGEIVTWRKHLPKCWRALPSFSWFPRPLPCLSIVCCPTANFPSFWSNEPVGSTCTVSGGNSILWESEFFSYPLSVFMGVLILWMDRGPRFFAADSFEPALVERPRNSNGMPCWLCVKRHAIPMDHGANLVINRRTDGRML